MFARIRRVEELQPPKRQHKSSVMRLRLVAGAAALVAAIAPAAPTAAQSGTWRGAGSPVARYGHVMAYDASRGAAVVFTGNAASDVVDYVSDTWEWSGTAWTQRSTTGPTRYAASAVFDSGRGVTVLFGGYTDTF